MRGPAPCFCKCLYLRKLWDVHHCEDTVNVVVNLAISCLVINILSSSEVIRTSKQITDGCYGQLEPRGLLGSSESGRKVVRFPCSRHFCILR
ncbi:uncharacterized protein J3R85_014488 [Psidium guajava]|nr:uncharacterized protein J3R85_014488 [Psidium guajava]